MISKSSTDTQLPGNTTWVEHAENLAKVFGHDDQQEKIERESVVVFQVGEENYGTPISNVKEIVKAPPISTIPQTSPYLVGVTNVRGNIIAVLDAQMRISGSTTATAKNFLLVINNENIKLGILVESVPFTITVDKKSINNSTNVIQNLSEEDKFVSGLVKHENKMVFLINVLKMI